MSGHGPAVCQGDVVHPRKVEGRAGNSGSNLNFAMNGCSIYSGFNHRSGRVVSLLGPTGPRAISIAERLRLMKMALQICSGGL